MPADTQGRIDYITDQSNLVQVSEAKLFHCESNGLDATELLELVAKWVTLESGPPIPTSLQVQSIAQRG